MSITLTKCFECGKVISGNLNDERKKPAKYEECKKCQEKREREEGKDERNG